MRLDLDSLVLAPCAAVFGEPAVYRPGDGASFPVTGVFDRAHTEIRLIDGVPVNSTMPVLGVRTAEFPRPPQQGDLVDVQGTTYVVGDVRPDGHGHAKLMLKLFSI